MRRVKSSTSLRPSFTLVCRAEHRRPLFPPASPRPQGCPMSQALHPMLNIAIKAARAAGAIINRASLDLESVRISVKQTNDFVTEIDQAAEAAIIETLLTAY